MSLISNMFILFVFISVLLYYLIPQKYRWCALLVCSYYYYFSSGVQYLFFILFSTIVTYIFAIFIERVDEDKKRKRTFLILGLTLNFGCLGILKYTNFIVENINAIFNLKLSGINLLLPLGISFYTFQSSGYLLDVYWKRSFVENNIFKYGLFVSFFPQILQGPIGRHSKLASQLYAGKNFEWNKVERGLERILWGFFKKLVLADWAAVFVEEIFGNPEYYNGIAVFGVLFYSIQLYADFSGGMDVVIGIASLFGITLDENFKRPYFAISISDFWHRWHITLGTWMKDYVFYPLSLSKGMSKLGKGAKKVFGKKTGRKIPVCIANLIVFFIVGVWHGPAWKFIAYGMFSGVIIAFSGLMGEQYRKWKRKLHIQDNIWWYRGFMIIRTFVLVNISWFFDCADSVKQAFMMMKQAATNFKPEQLLLISAGKEGVTFTPFVLGILGVGCLILLIVEIMQEKGQELQEIIQKQNYVVRVFVYVSLLLIIGFFGSTAAVRGFIYAQF